MCLELLKNGPASIGLLMKDRWLYPGQLLDDAGDIVLRGVVVAVNDEDRRNSGDYRRHFRSVRFRLGCRIKPLILELADDVKVIVCVLQVSVCAKSRTA